MAQSTVNVDQIVREVLAALGVSSGDAARAGGAVVGGSADDDAGRGGRAAVRDALDGSLPAGGDVTRLSVREPGATKNAPAADDLRLEGRVITLADIAGRLEGARRVVVSARAVVTPAVRDELRRRGAAMVREDYTTKAAGSLRLVAKVLGARFDPAAITAAMEGEPVQVQAERRDCLIVSTDELARELTEANTAGLIVTTHPAMALRLAARHRGLRPVWGVDHGRLERDLADIGANVLVIDPRATSPYQLRRMLGDYCRLGPAECPELLRKALAKTSS